MVRLLYIRRLQAGKDTPIRRPRVRYSQGAGSAYSEREVVFNQPGTHSPERTDLPAQKGTDRELEGPL